MRTYTSLLLLALALSLFFPVVGVVAEDWPQWGGNSSKNMMSPETGITSSFDPGKEKDDGSEQIDLATTKNVKWVAKVGSETYGNTTVAGGKVYIGTNNQSPRDPKHKGDRGIILCLEEDTGKCLWQLVVPKLGAGKVSDWEYLGICSSPTVEGDRVYIVTNRCEVVCMDANGLADGNDGPYQDEGQYMAGSGNPPIEIGPTDADIIWVFDMREELSVFPHNIASSSVLVVGDRVYATTSNGQDWSHVNIPSPFAPALCCLDKKTGELLGEEASGIGQRIMHCNWSSPAYGEAGGKGLVIFGAGDGFCYGFDPVPVKEDEEDEDAFDILPEIWRCDCVPPEYKKKDGEPIKYPSPKGASEIISTPVFYNGKVYVSIGQDPEHGEGVGALICIDASKSGDITESGNVWTYKGMGRSISTASIMNGLLFVGDYGGRIHCLDAITGKVHWVHDTGSHIWSSTLAADGKVYLGNEDGVLTILEAGKEKKLIGEVEFNAPIYSSPVVANGVLYVATQTHLYAIAKAAK